MKVTLTRITENPITAIEEAASNCYDSTPTEDGKIAKACFSSGHLSVFEFCTFTFHIEGVSRALLAQLTRHRHASFAVRSQRYCKECGFDYYTPPTIADNLAALEIYQDTMEYLNRRYMSFINEYNIPAEDARMLLPNSCATQLEFSCNGRELIFIMNERLCTRAQKEIRELCQAMREAIIASGGEAREFAMKYCTPKCIKDGFCREHSSCGIKPRLKDILKVYQEHERTVLETSN